MIILASASPRRKELLQLITDEFEVIPSDVDESVSKEISVDAIPQYLAEMKAEDIHKAHFDDVVIGCDTGVFIDGTMLGKPSSKENAFEMLRALSGRTHKVITGCAILYKSKKISFSCTTEVSFYELEDREISDYIETGEPMDKAGAYGIQGKGSLLVKGIDGDFFNVVGLPVSELSRQLKKIY